MDTVVDFKSIAGIAAVVVLVVEGLKKTLAGTRVDIIPVWFWVLLVSAGVTALAYFSGFLSVSYQSAVSQVILGALTASGAFSWYKRPDSTLDGTTVKASVTQLKVLAIAMLVTVALMGAVGCVDTLQAKDRTFVGGVESTWTEVKKDWVPRVNADPNLTAQEKLNRVGAKDSLVSEMDALLAKRKEMFNAPK